MKAQGTIGVAVALAAEKRMVYARFLQLARAAFEEASVLVFDGTALPMDEASLPPLPPGSKLEYTGRYEAGTPFALAMAELNKCYDEVVIVGGHEVGTDASAAMSAISGYVSGTVDVWGVHRTLGDLSTAMHEDANRVRVNGSSSRRTA